MDKIQNLLLFLSCIIFCSTSCREKDSLSLPRSTPSEEKFSEISLNDYLMCVDTSLHTNKLSSFMLLRNGKVIAEKWYGNNNPSTQYRTYSASKTFTAIAVGFAINEKLIKLEDKVISFFPDDVPDSISSNMQDMCIEDLLTMQTGHASDPTELTNDEYGSWEKIFFEAPVEYQPGTHFVYNSLASYMLSGIIQKVTGMEMIDYLQPRLFAPLQIVNAKWVNSPTGINVGGDGLYVTTEDMAKFGQFLLNKGKWNGQQLLPAEWIEEASRLHVSLPPLSDEIKKEDSGYCYQMWRTPRNGFAAQGYLGQFIIVLPDQNAVIVNTADNENTQFQESQIWKKIFPGFQE